MKQQNSRIYHQRTKAALNASSYTWEEEQTIPFDELMISWNATRPTSGEYAFFVSVKIDDWSEWCPYASWGIQGQRGGAVFLSESSIKISQDILEILDGKFATGFRIRVEASQGADLIDFYALHVCTTCLGELYLQGMINVNVDIDLPMPMLSQLLLQHPRNRHICSAASTTAVVRYLLKNDDIDAVSFALKAHDEAFDIFGNWVLNVAQASSIMGKNWECWVQRLSGFDDIFEQLVQNLPVVVSVKGPLLGSALPYDQGHLMVVRGYDVERRRVLCMDPAFSTDKETHTSYAVDDFLEAWGRRRYVAYLFRFLGSILA